MINLETELKVEISPNAAKNGFLARWSIPHELSYLRGHFPGFPVVPGVAVIDVTLEVLRRALMLPAIQLAELENAKFTQPIQPGQEMEIEILRTSDGARWSAQWKSQQATSVAELTFRLNG